MAESKRIQPRQIRMSDETKAKIDALAAELGCNTAETIEMLISQHGLELTKTTVPEQAASVDQFKALTRNMIDLFENSVMLYANAKDVARQEFVSQLEAQAFAINEAEHKITAGQVENERLNARIKELLGLAKQIEALKSTIEDKNKTIADKDRTIADKEAIISGHVNLEQQLGEALSRNNQMNDKIDTLQNSLTEASADAAAYKSEAQLAAQALNGIREQLIQVQNAADKHATQYEKQIAVMERQIAALEKAQTEKDLLIAEYQERLLLRQEEADENLKRLRYRGDETP